MLARKRERKESVIEGRVLQPPVNTKHSLTKDGRHCCSCPMLLIQQSNINLQKDSVTQSDTQLHQRERKKSSGKCYKLQNAVWSLNLLFEPMD